MLVQLFTFLSLPILWPRSHLKHFCATIALFSCGAFINLSQTPFHTDIVYTSPQMPNKILPSSLSGSAKSLLFAQIHLSCALCPFLSYPTSLIYAPLPSQSCFSCCVFRYIRTPSKNLALGSHPHLIKVPLQRRINSSSALSPSYEVFVFSV